MKTLIKEIETFKSNVRLAEATIKSYSNMLNQFSHYLSIKTSEDIEQIYLDKIYLLKDSSGTPIRYLPIDASLMNDYFKTLISRGYNALRLHHAALMSFFSFLEKNYNFDNPLLELDFKLSDYKPEKTYTNVFSRGEIIKFFNSIISTSNNVETDLLLFSILITTGCRISEILNLRCKEIDFSNNTFLIIKAKNKQQRIVNLRPGIGDILKIYTDNHNKVGDDYLFSKLNSNKKFNHKHVDQLLKKYLSHANLPPLTIHGFRHTFATLMADENTPITFIQQLLGHKSINSTKLYINPHYVRNRDINIPENQQILDFVKNNLDCK